MLIIGSRGTPEDVMRTVRAKRTRRRRNTVAARALQAKIEAANGSDTQSSVNPSSFVIAIHTGPSSRNNRTNSAGVLGLSGMPNVELLHARRVEGRKDLPTWWVR